MFDLPREQRPKRESEIDQLRAKDPAAAIQLAALARTLYERYGVKLQLWVPDGTAEPVEVLPPAPPPPPRPDSLAIATAEPDKSEARHEKIASHIRRAITAGGAVLATLGLTKPQWFSWLFEHANTIATLVGFALPFVTAWWSTRNINRTKTHEAQRVTAAQYVPAPVAGQQPLSVAEVKAVAQSAVTRATGQVKHGEQSQ